MGDQIFGIDKGIIRAFGLTVVVVGILTTFFLSEYVAAIILGSVFNTTDDIPVTADTTTFLGTAEDDFVTTFTNVNTAVKFAATLITVVAVILVFASFLPKRGKGKKSMDY